MQLILICKSFKFLGKSLTTACVVLRKRIEDKSITKWKPSTIKLKWLWTRSELPRQQRQK